MTCRYVQIAACSWLVVGFLFTPIQALPGEAASYSEQKILESIDTYISDQMTHLEIPGVAIGIVRGSEVTYVRGYGVADRTGRAATPETPFLIASFSKSFTALGIMQLVEASKIELDAPVQKYLPWFWIADQDSSSKITIRHLLNQTSGFSEREGYKRNLDSNAADNALETSIRGLRGTSLLYAGAPLDKLPAVSIIAFVNGFRDGMHLPQGGMGKIPEALAHTLQQHGGEILLNTSVRKICIKAGRACGVQIDGHGVVEADFVISTVNAMATYQSLLDDSDQPKQLVRKVKKTPLSMGAFCIQLGISNMVNTTSHIHHVVPMIGDLCLYIQPAQDMPEWGYYSIPTIVAPELAPAGHSILEYVPVIRQDEPTEAWDDERIDDLSNRSIDWLRSRHPMNIELKRIRSPREFEKQRNLYRRAIYGVSAAKGLTGLFSHKSPINGLYLAGQTTYPGLGVPTAALSGIHASKILIEEMK